MFHLKQRSIWRSYKYSFVCKVLISVGISRPMVVLITNIMVIDCGLFAGWFCESSMHQCFRHCVSPPGSERELGEVLPNGVSSEVARNKLAHRTVWCFCIDFIQAVFSQPSCGAAVLWSISWTRFCPHYPHYQELQTSAPHLLCVAALQVQKKMSVVLKLCLHSITGSSCTTMSGKSCLMAKT